MRSFSLFMLVGLMTALSSAEDPFALFGQEKQGGVRLKDLIHIKGVMDNHLTGVGVVVGLKGTGDSEDATLKMLKNFLRHQNHQFAEDDLDTKNIAMVALTADLPIFAKEGARLPVQVSSIGGANSLAGGTLLMTALAGADRGIYAVAQGGVHVDTSAGSDRHETVATLPGGAVVIREVETNLLYDGKLVMNLRQPDFTTAQLVASALNSTLEDEDEAYLSEAVVIAEDASTITLEFNREPQGGELVGAISKIEAIRVMPDLPARVVLNPRTGTVVVGANVSIGKAAVAHGNLSLRVLPQSRRQSDPNDPSRVVEHTVWVDPTTGRASEQPPAGLVVTPNVGPVTVVEGATVEEIANALNAMGAAPKDLVAIFQALSRSGALHGELVVQ